MSWPAEPIDTTYRLAVGNVIACHGRPGLWVVTDIRKQSDGYGHGPHDRFAGGYRIRCEALSQDGEYVHGADEHTFSVLSDDADRVESVPVYGSMRMVRTFVKEPLPVDNGGESVETSAPPFRR